MSPSEYPIGLDADGASTDGVETVRPPIGQTTNVTLPASACALLKICPVDFAGRRYPTRIGVLQ